MLKVFKYPIPINDDAVMELPEGARILHVDAQRGQPMLWALVNPDAPMEKRKFRFAGTGHQIIENPDSLIHQGTFKLHGDDLIFHIFEIKEQTT